MIDHELPLLRMQAAELFDGVHDLFPFKKFLLLLALLRDLFPLREHPRVALPPPRGLFLRQRRKSRGRSRTRSLRPRAELHEWLARLRLLLRLLLLRPLLRGCRFYYMC